MADDKPDLKAREPSVEQISVDEAIKLLSRQGTNRLIQVRRDRLDPSKIINIIVHE